MSDNWKWKGIGYCGVDAGLLMIADPCYWIDRKTEDGEDAWRVFLDTQRSDSEEYSLNHQVNFDHGHEGKGVIAGTAHGDGSYPVYALKGRGDSAKAMLVLTDDMTDSEIDELCALLKSIRHNDEDNDEEE